MQDHPRNRSGDPYERRNKTLSYVVIARWSGHGAKNVELDCSGRLVGARQAIDSGGPGATAGLWNAEHA